ncbi:hypothetical protein IVB06_20380 [Bradyrhizobium sp. 171]|nr:hypothetical protein [Bradyrhizobium sp. 176]MCK1558624.1 hypothetical protein [Bradyrhizobium sp. 171]MCK1689585.1 hypothetical protein [Bradyrhizobium sp. 145]
MSLQRHLAQRFDPENLLVWSAGLPGWRPAGEVDKPREMIPPPVPEEHRSSMPEWQVRWWWYAVAVSFSAHKAIPRC